MITFPIAKINLGLNVVERRPDGYHNLETVFYPVPIKDVLEATVMDDRFPCEHKCDLKVSNISVEGNEQDNLVLRAYRLIEDYLQDSKLKTQNSKLKALPRLHVHLYKGIPTMAGMGGGSSDAAYMLMTLNEEFKLGLGEQELIELSARLGADCPFFIMSRAAYAEGIGERLQPIDLDLSGWWIAVVRPPIPVSTREAFSLIKPCKPELNCRDIVLNHKVEEWRGLLTNDFEQSVFALHPEIGRIKERLYELGAAYAAMSGSGSCLFGLFREPVDLTEFQSEGTFCTVLRL